MAIMLTFLREALALARAYRKQQGDARPKSDDGPRQFFHEEDADERNAKALATYEAEHGPVMSLDEIISRRSR